MTRLGYNLGLQSSQNVESKWESVESKLEKCGVNKLIESNNQTYNNDIMKAVFHDISYNVIWWKR